MTLNQLELFIDAARTLNFTRTGEHFFISQSAVTQQIRNLEDELEVPLFKRDKRKLSLTEAGQLFVREAQSLIEHTQEAIGRVRSVQEGDTGHLNIGYLATMDTDKLPTVIYKYHMKYPGVHLNLTRDHAQELYDGFQVGKYDVIFNVSIDEFDAADVISLPMGSFGFVVCMPPNHRLATNRIIRQGDLKSEQLIVQFPGADSSTSNVVLHNMLDSELLHNVISVETDTIAATLMVAAGLGIAIIPAIGIDQIKQQLICVPLDTIGYQLSVMLHYHKEHHNPAIERFVAECQP